ERDRQRRGGVARIWLQLGWHRHLESQGSDCVRRERDAAGSPHRPFAPVVSPRLPVARAARTNLVLPGGGAVPGEPGQSVVPGILRKPLVAFLRNPGEASATARGAPLHRPPWCGSGAGRLVVPGRRRRRRNTLLVRECALPV